jgi:hypothetical protein
VDRRRTGHARAQVIFRAGSLNLRKLAPCLPASARDRHTARSTFAFARS